MSTKLILLKINAYRAVMLLFVRPSSYSVSESIQSISIKFGFIRNSVAFSLKANYTD
jgi:hypothetical protein